MALRLSETAGARDHRPSTVHPSHAAGARSVPEIREFLFAIYRDGVAGRTRRASSSDLGSLAAIEVAAGARFRDIGLDDIADDPGPTIAELAPHLDNSTIWVAEDGDTIVGYATASIVDGEGHLDQVSVIPEAGGKGFGLGLITEVHSWAHLEGLPSVTLTTFRDVAWNGPFYERFGYVVLSDDDLGPELRAIRQHEIDAGLDVLPRVAMRLVLPAPPFGSVRS